jgi:hypothetical protein
VFTLLQMLPMRRLASEQVPALLGAWVIAELFYKFHSFSLECAAFLLTWVAFDGLLQLIKCVLRRGSAAAAALTRK